MKRLSPFRVVMSAATLAGLASLPPRADAQTPPQRPAPPARRPLRPGRGADARACRRTRRSRRRSSPRRRPRPAG